jgi:hypothetical protein
MSTRLVGITFIVIGVLTMIFSRLMEVTVGGSDIVNIHLLSERQNTLIFGGLLFLAGIILYSAFKSKQTKEEESIEKLKSQENRSVIWTRIKNMMLRVRSLFTDSSEGWKSIFSKISIGLYFGIVSTAIAQLFLDPWFSSGRGYLDRAEYYNYVENFYYFIFIIIFLVAIKKGTKTSSFIFSLLASIGFFVIVVWIIMN